MDTILDLPKEYAFFSQAEKDLFDSVYSFSVSTGRMVIPRDMKAWVTKQFGSADAVETQSILRVTNKLTLESSLFNRLRASRPIHTSPGPTMKDLLVEAGAEPFSDVEGMTPEDTFGRIKGPHNITASNVAKYDANHGLVIFDKPDPRPSSEKETVSHFNTALKWIAEAGKNDPKALYPVIAWNSLWKAGASLVHGHLQVLLTRGEHYPAMKLFKKTEDEYQEIFGRSYADAIFEIHSKLSLGAEKNSVRILAHLTPRKEKEVILLSPEADDTLFSLIHRALGAMANDLGVESFNLAVIMPPLDGSWGRFPVITRIVDRGPLSSRTTDVAAMELLLNQSVVASDPVKVWSMVKSAL